MTPFGSWLLLAGIAAIILSAVLVYLAGSAWLDRAERGVDFVRPIMPPVDRFRPELDAPAPHAGTMGEATTASSAPDSQSGSAAAERERGNTSPAGDQRLQELLDGEAALAGIRVLHRPELHDWEASQEL